MAARRGNQGVDNTPANTTANNPKADAQTQPKDNQQTPEPKEETKENAKKMGFKGLGLRFLNSAVDSFREQMREHDTGFYDPLKMLMGNKETEEKNANATPKDILGQIYKAMVKIDNYRKLQYEESRNHLQK